ncbi:Isochorismatase family protein [compost metagenome]
MITTASVPDGPNGPLIPEIHQHAPHAVYVPRTGQINTWDNPLFVKEIEKTGRKTLIIAGTLTSVCMAFPAVSAVQAGYKAYCVVDASGNWSKLATDTTIARVTQAGAIPTDTFAIVAELMQTWNRPEGSRFAEILADHVCPEYKCLIESYGKAQEIAKNGPETHLDKYR